MDKILLDSSIWIALYDSNDQQHEKAEKLVLELEKGNIGFVINNYIDIECISVLLRNASFHVVEGWIKFRSFSQEMSFLHFDEEDHKNVTKFFLKLKNKHLSFTDVSLVYLSKNGIKVVTFDKKLEKALQSNP